MAKELQKSVLKNILWMHASSIFGGGIILLVIIWLLFLFLYGEFTFWFYLIIIAILLSGFFLVYRKYMKKINL